jgi:hypothetical protein
MQAMSRLTNGLCLLVFAVVSPGLAQAAEDIQRKPPLAKQRRDAGVNLFFPFFTYQFQTVVRCFLRDLLLLFLEEC